MKNYYPEMQPDQFYHVFNRGNNREDIFYKPENVPYFLKKYSKYISPVVDTYVYSLLPNHFHFLVRVKSLEEMLGQAVNTDFPGFENLESLARREAEPVVNTYISELVSNQFRLFFMSYAKAINKQVRRTGSLLQKNFKRLAVNGVQHRVNLVLYIHANAQLHDLCDDFRDWADSSYFSMLANGTTKLRRSEVLDWFGGKEQFVKAHADYIGWKTAGDWVIED
jgi:putative transposase